jgi:phage shock protein PspC (stress-responsive transcriptional regulator)
VPDQSTAPATTVRVRQGRWLGGVCAGLAQRLSTSPQRVRLVFVLLTFVGLIGPLAYLAFLLILPEEGTDEQSVGPRTIVSIAQIVGAVLSLTLLAVLGAAAQLFGYGWVPIGAAALALVWVVVRWRRSGPAWAILPIAALTLPASAIALIGLSLAPDVSTTRLQPRTLADLGTDTVKRGLAPTEVDLRDTALPRTGTARLQLDTGFGDTVVALPHDRCIRVVVDRTPPTNAWRRTLAVFGTRSDDEPVVLFGTYHYGFATTAHGSAHKAPLTLRIAFSSLHGRLTVRDYPDRVDPLDVPGWPLPEGLTGLSPKQVRQVVRDYPDDFNVGTQQERELPGPCATA